MTSENSPAQPAGRRGYVRYGRNVVRELLMRVTNGESVHAICRDDAHMPTKQTVSRWARERPRFKARLEAARRLAGRYGRFGHQSRFCEVTAQEVFLRLAAGETMEAICADPEMPAETTVARWRRLEPEFDEALKVAREIQAERFADRSIGLAEAATPETAFLTGVRLAHIRWLTAIHGPRTFSRTKPREAPEEEKRLHICIRRFEVETREDGMRRMVSYVADPGTRGVVRDSEGEWHEPPQRIAG
jgi:hypothetical protein